jgi:hypothetical protein
MGAAVGISNRIWLKCVFTASVLVGFALPVSSFAQQAKITISVFDSNSPKTLVPSTLRVVTITDGPSYYFSGKPDSLHPKTAFCQQGQAVVAEPDNKAYYFNSKNFDCTFPLKIPVLPRYDFAYIVTKAEGFYDAGDYAKSALLYSEAAGQASAIGKGESYSDLAKKTYVSVGKVLGVDNAISTLPGEATKFWMSNDLKSTLEKYQASANIPVTGKIDYSTLQTMSGTNIGAYLHCPPSCGPAPQM